MRSEYDDGKMLEYDEAVKPFLLGEGRNAVLLIHGFTGAPYEMKEFGEYLAGRGFRVYAPLLPGHGTNKEDMIKTNRTDWIEGAEQGLKLLLSEAPENIFVSGLSMGGTLTLYLGATHPEVKALAPICAAVCIQDWRARFLLPILRYFFRYSPFSAEPVNILDKSLLDDPVAEEVRSRYDRPAVSCAVESLRLLREVKEKMIDINQPILIIQARKDGLVPPSNAEYIYQTVSSLDKRILWLENSAHLATLDFEKHTVFRETADFFLDLTQATP